MSAIRSLIDSVVGRIIRQRVVRPVALPSGEIMSLSFIEKIVVSYLEKHPEKLEALIELFVERILAILSQGK